MLILFTGNAQTGDKKCMVAIDGLAPALKFGVKNNYSERFSLQASTGFCLVGPSLLSYNFLEPISSLNLKKL